MELLVALNKKNYRVFGKFFDENFPFLVMFADKYLEDMDLAADVAQEAFIQLWRFEGEFESLEKVKGFLYTTARHLALNHLKHDRIVEEYVKIQEKETDIFSGIRLLKKKLISWSIKLLISWLNNPEKLYSSVFRGIPTRRLQNNYIYLSILSVLLNRMLIKS